MPESTLTVRRIKVFLSSPGDVAAERAVVRQVLGSLQKERIFADRFLLVEVSWDDPEHPAPLDASLTPQQAINRERGKPSDCDVVVVILWSRLGTPLRDEHGKSWRSGTEWEFHDALDAAIPSGRPTVWLYRRDEEPTVPLRHPNRDEIIRQADLVDDFFEKLKNPDGSLCHAHHPYANPEAFRWLFQSHLRDWLSKQSDAAPSVTLGRAGPANGAPVSDLPELPGYRAAALHAHEKLPITGFATKARVAIQLDELFVPLRAMLDTRLKGDCGFADARDAEERLRPHDAAEIPLIDAFRAAAERRRDGLVILGDPGSGKTTQLKRLLLACLREGPESLGLPPDMLPVFLPLRDLEDLRRGVDAFIESTLDSPHLAMGAGFGRRLLERGCLLLLFDGLDEVSDPAQRARVSRWIEDLARQRPNCLPVVTCRFAGYGDDARLGPEFLELHLRPLTPEQSEQFISNWYKVVTLSQSPGPAALAEAAAEAGTLIRRLREPDYRSARMAEMTRNPLLLANLCLVHYDRKGLLPQGRHELYDECIQVLLELWRRDKKLAVRVPARTGRELLGPVALWLHGQEGHRSRASLAELIPVLEPAIAKAQWPGDAASFLRAVRDESGLLTGWGQDQYGFMHLGFQEYLAATDIRRRVLDDLVAGRPPAALTELAGHYADSWWQEVILLLLAQGDPPLFEPFMQAALLHPDFDATDDLMRFILEEAVGVSAEPFKRFLRYGHPPSGEEWTTGWMAVCLLDRLLNPEALQAFAQTLPESTRAAVGLSLARLAERVERAGAAATPGRLSRNGEVELVALPGGRFLMGSPPGVGRGDERPQHEVDVRPFCLGRYPVTNAEYRRFLEAHADAREPDYWADRRFNHDRQPVVGVSWEEARRFCAWAGGRLPTEAEWEYACRAGRATAFHWGDDADRAAEYAWFGEHWEKGGTHPVGGKRPNPWGLHDLTGNVWEWMEDAWHDDYAGAPVDGSAWIAGGGRRVIRGGSWNLVPAVLRSATRFGFTPDIRDDDLGFRLAQDLE